MKKKTAVEQLQEWLNSHLSHDQQMQFEGLFQQAKQLEKQQIIDAWIVENNPLQRLRAENYYQETFKK
jgi:hypothetical protein